MIVDHQIRKRIKQKVKKNLKGLFLKNIYTCGTENNTLISCFFRSSASIQKSLQSFFGPSFWGAACRDRSLVCSPLSVSYLRPRWAETQIPPRSRETGSDRFAPSSVSIALNSRHIALHRPGTGGGQRAPVGPLPPNTFVHRRTRQVAGRHGAQRIYHVSKGLTGTLMFQFVSFYKN